jgi:hypothetical protein
MASFVPAVATKPDDSREVLEESELDRSLPLLEEPGGPGHVLEPGWSSTDMAPISWKLRASVFACRPTTR